MCLSSTIIEKIQVNCANEPGMVIAYFYFDFANTDQQGVKPYLSSLIGQICRQRKNIPDGVQFLYDRHLSQQHRPTSDDLLEALFAASEGLQVCVISDALDECAERETLLETLSTIATRKSSNIKILATSRK